MIVGCNVNVLKATVTRFSALLFHGEQITYDPNLIAFAEVSENATRIALLVARILYLLFESNNLSDGSILNRLITRL
jgi:hypothetical protein